MFFCFLSWCSIRCVISSMMKVIMNSRKVSVISVDFCRFIVLLNWLVMVEVIEVFGFSSEGDSFIVLLSMKVIVIVLFSVWFRLRKMLLIIVEWVYGSMMF